MLKEMDGIEPLEKSMVNCSITEDAINHVQEHLEKSMMSCSLTEEDIDQVQEQPIAPTHEKDLEVDCPSLFGFKKYHPPPLLCRHPPPAIGRDDDVHKLKEVLDDILIKLQHDNLLHKADRILFGPDNKIGANLFKLGGKYRAFLAEFPLLHLRKSKITILFSAYKDAGLLHILKYMRDDDRQEWAKLITAQHIDLATRNVKRLSQALHLSFLVCFIQTLPPLEGYSLLDSLTTICPDQISLHWEKKYEMFMEQGKKNNATFLLHAEMMQHCDEVVAVALAERLGGEGGYNLLLATVKSSLLFSFVNGASNYAPFCARLLHEHYSCGTFHQHMKYSLFSTPIGNSEVNFACDTKREMDHIEALKAFRSGSTLTSVTNRMSLVDSLKEVHESMISSTMDANEHKASRKSHTWKLTEVDHKHIYPTAALILRAGGLSLEQQDVPLNVYSSPATILPVSILDRDSFGVGEYLLKRFIAKNELFNCSESDIPDADKITGPRSLVSRAKRSKGVTMKRASKKQEASQRSEHQKREEQRKRGVKRETKQADCLSSDMNLCQAIVKPDCSKPKVQKAKGSQKALTWLVQHCVSKVQDDGLAAMLL